jgi:hypothetical protein
LNCRLFVGDDSFDAKYGGDRNTGQWSERTQWNYHGATSALGLNMAVISKRYYYRYYPRADSRKRPDPGRRFHGYLLLKFLPYTSSGSYFLLPIFLVLWAANLIACARQSSRHLYRCMKDCELWQLEGD